MHRIKRLLAWTVVAVLWPAVPLMAHPAPFSFLDVRLEEGRVDAAVVMHLLDLAYELEALEGELAEPSGLAQRGRAIQALVAERLALWADGERLSGGRMSEPELVPERHGVRVRVQYDVPRPPGRIVIAAWMFPYDPIHQTFLNVYERGDLTTQAILDANRVEFEYFPGTRQGALTVVRKFAASGVHHILIGPDHLLFLFGLLLLGGSIRRLVLVVSAFTLAHSVTLSLAALRVLSPPESIVEPAIALSIVYVGADNLTVRGGRDMRVWIAFAFGLVHGFGFANVLREMDLPARALGLSLFSFNLGVEIGQVLVVVPVAAAVAAIRTRSETAARRVATAGSVLVILAGGFWFVERVFFGG